MMFHIAIIILSLIGLVTSLFAYISSKKICKEYNDLLDKYAELKTIEMRYDCLVRENKVLVQENKQLKDELHAERKIAKSNNVKKVEDLPKTEKVSKPRTRKTTKK